VERRGSTSEKTCRALSRASNTTIRYNRVQQCPVRNTVSCFGKASMPFEVRAERNGVNCLRSIRRSRPATAAFSSGAAAEHRLDQLPLRSTQQPEPLLAHARSRSSRPPPAEVFSLRLTLFMKHALAKSVSRISPRWIAKALVISFPQKRWSTISMSRALLGPD
jgi:hypothetical protein